MICTYHSSKLDFVGVCHLWCVFCCEVSEVRKKSKVAHFFWTSVIKHLINFLQTNWWQISSQSLFWTNSSWTSISCWGSPVAFSVICGNLRIKYQKWTIEEHELRSNYVFSKATRRVVASGGKQLTKLHLIATCSLPFCGSERSSRSKTSAWRRVLVCKANLQTKLPRPRGRSTIVWLLEACQQHWTTLPLQVFKCLGHDRQK